MKLYIRIALFLALVGCSRKTGIDWHWKETPTHMVDGEAIHEFPNFELPCKYDRHLIGWVWEQGNSWYGLLYETRQFHTSIEAKQWVEEEMTKYCGEGQKLEKRTA